MAEESTTTGVPFLGGHVLGAADWAKDVAETPIAPYAGQRVAPLSGLQQQAIGLTEQGIGQYMPYLTQATEHLQAAPQMFGATMPQAMEYMAQGRQAFDPSTGVSPYMDPYQQQVIDVTKADMELRAAQQQDALNAQAATQGAFGGTRHGIETGDLARQQQRGMTEALAGIRSRGYGNALGAAMGEHSRTGQAAYQAGTGIAGLGQTGASLGMQTAAGMAGLGSQFQGQLGTDVAALGAAGGLQQGQLQKDLAVAQQFHEEVQREPREAASWYTGILSGTPQTETTQTTVPDPNAWTQGIGALGAGYDLGKKFGWWG